MLRRFYAHAFFMTLFQMTPANAQDVFPLGVWADANKRMVVRVTPCDVSGTAFCGTIVQDNRRGRPINRPGHIIIRGLAPEKSHWAGQAYDGITRFRFTLHPIANDAAQARLCIIGALCLNEKVERDSNLVVR